MCISLVFALSRLPPVTSATYDAIGCVVLLTLFNRNVFEWIYINISQRTPAQGTWYKSLIISQAAQINSVSTIAECTKSVNWVIILALGATYITLDHRLICT